MVYRHRYVVFYHWLHKRDGTGQPNERCQRIANAKPEMLFTYSHLHGSGRWGTGRDGELNLTPQVISLLHGKGVKIYNYIPTEWGRYSIDATKDLIAVAKELGLKGVKFDEAQAFAEGLETSYAPTYLAYYRQIYAYAKAKGLGVMANTGTEYTNEVWLSEPLCDLVGVEHGWKVFPTLKAPYNCGGGWYMSKYSSDKFMGVSSKMYDKTMNLEVAVKDTLGAWNMGFGWHYSCESWWIDGDYEGVHYDIIPTWFEEYTSRITPTPIPFIAKAVLSLVTLGSLLYLAKRFKG